MMLLRWSMGLLIAGLILIVPVVHYRAVYAHSKRIRIVTEGRFLRCGQLTAKGFREVLLEHGVKTVINLQDEAPDPLLPESYYSKPSIRESEVCEQCGAKYRLLEFDLIARSRFPGERPAVIDHYLQILDDPDSYPILLHCKAGLHRTGLLTALYRIEYEGWTTGAAVRELRANGFGDIACTTANEYLVQFLEHYRPGERHLPASILVDVIVGATARSRVYPTTLRPKGEGTP